METKHTEGPWEHRAIPGHLFEIHDADKNVVFRIRSGMMPTLEHARLIAAAPELLQAVEKCLREFPNDPCDPRIAEAVAMCRAAIAKARG